MLAIAGLFLLIALRGPQGLPTLLDKQRQIRSLQAQNAEMAQENEAKRRRIERLRTSRAEQEYEIRRRWKLVRPGETQIIIPGAPANE